MQTTTDTIFSTATTKASINLEAMDNPAIIDLVLDNEDSTEIECEMASRLIGAMEEIDRLVVERAELLGARGQVQH